ncbi:hypothetical protein PR048_005197 [Dryococelus australis]|uniref:Transposase n=1 Tax=Dryococelus australis TaxID=614101 RepID=A0ABQ9I7L0_9NEOP|nr:hypothetical protein PR048_005197 [Dryococelus australis]
MCAARGIRHVAVNLLPPGEPNISAIGHALGLSKSTVQTILRNRTELEKLLASDTLTLTDVRVINRTPIMIHTERLLIDWVDTRKSSGNFHCFNRNILAVAKFSQPARDGFYGSQTDIICTALENSGKQLALILMQLHHILAF